MGLAAEFKQFVRNHIPEAIVDGQPADICVIDAMCSLRGFSPDCDPGISTRPLDALVTRIFDGVVAACAPKCTLLVVFDRQRSTTRMKENEQQKRNVKRARPGAAPKEWTVAETEAMLAARTLPEGAEWGNLLDNREMRSLVVQAIADTLFARFRDGDQAMDRVGRLVVVNGRIAADLERGYGPRAETADRVDSARREVGIDEAPWTGEADVAMARWVRILLEEHRGAPIDPPRVAVHTVDTDIVPIFMMHGGKNCIVHLSAPNPQHRMRIGMHALANAFSKEYGLRPEEAVVVAISKKTDFTKACLKGLPDWHTTMKLAGEHLRLRRDETLVRAGMLNLPMFLRMLDAVAVVASNKRKVVVASLKADDTQRLRFVTKYWLQLEAE